MNEEKLLQNTELSRSNAWSTTNIRQKYIKWFSCYQHNWKYSEGILEYSERVSTDHKSWEEKRMIWQLKDERTESKVKGQIKGKANKINN